MRYAGSQDRVEVEIKGKYWTGRETCLVGSLSREQLRDYSGSKYVTREYETRQTKLKQQDFPGG